MAELKPAIAKMVARAEGKAGVWLQDSAGKQAKFENLKESSIASSSTLFFHLRLSVHQSSLHSLSSFLDALE